MATPWELNWSECEVLGEGAQGVAKLVRHKFLPETIGALKYLKNNKSSQSRERLLREVTNLRSLHQLGAHVPQVLEHNSDAVEDLATRLYLVMEFIQGVSLESFVVKNGTLKLDDALRFTLSLCDIVKIAHGATIIHRDIKPSNIIVSDPAEAVLYIVDYGLSCAGDDSDLTQTSETFKSKFLALPEGTTPNGDRRDPRSDVTALCAVLYYMLTGHVIGQLADHNEKPPHLRPGYSLKEALPNDPRRAQLDMLLTRGLAVGIHNRFQTIDELIDRLRALIAQSADESAADPFALAQEFDVQLRQHSRRTQLGIFAPIASKVLDSLRLHVDKNYEATRLKPFSVVMRAGGYDAKSPATGDQLTGPYTMTLSLQHHGQIVHRVYKIIATGEQSIIIACEAQPKTTGQNPKFGDWTEIASFPADRDVVPAELLDAFDSELRAWLYRHMQLAADKALGA